MAISAASRGAYLVIVNGASAESGTDVSRLTYGDNDLHVTVFFNMFPPPRAEGRSVPGGIGADTRSPERGLMHNM